MTALVPILGGALIQPAHATEETTTSIVHATVVLPKFLRLKICKLVASVGGGRPMVNLSAPESKLVEVPTVVLTDSEQVIFVVQVNETYFSPFPSM